MVPKAMEKISEKEVETIKVLAERGTAVATISTVLSLDQAAVEAVLAPAPKPSPPSLEPKDVNTAKVLAENGAPASQIAQLLGVDEEAVKAVLKSEPPSLKPEEASTAKLLAELGHSISQIAQALSADEEAVKAVLGAPNLAPPSLKPEEANTAKLMAENGIPASQIAEVLGVSEAAVRSAVVGIGDIKGPEHRAMAGLNTSKSSAAAAKPPPPPPAQFVVPKQEDKTINCPLCFDEFTVPGGLDISVMGLIEFDCKHFLCRECFTDYMESKISEGEVSDDKLICPIPDCTTVVTEAQVQSANFEPELWNRYLNFRARGYKPEEYMDETMLECPTPDCAPFLVESRFATGVSVECPTCRKEFCPLCKESGHKNLTCEEARRRREALQDAVPRLRAKVEEAMQEALVRRCTGCGVPVERANACCHMTCGQCRAEFSWICGAPYRECREKHKCMDESIYLHAMPQLRKILGARKLGCTDENGSDLFLELRCLYLISIVKRSASQEDWDLFRRECPDVLENVIRGNWSIPWDEIGNFQRLHKLLPHAFPIPSEDAVPSEDATGEQEGPPQAAVAGLVGAIQGAVAGLVGGMPAPKGKAAGKGAKGKGAKGRQYPA